MASHNYTACINTVCIQNHVISQHQLLISIVYYSSLSLCQDTRPSEPEEPPTPSGSETSVHDDGDDPMEKAWG